MSDLRPGVRRFLAGTASLAVAATGLTLLGATQASANPAGTDLVISEAYGGGGNAGAPFKNDFIELYNRGTEPVPVTGWSVQ